jgi:hypothetical protein
MKIIGKTSLLLCIILLSINCARAQDAVAISSNPGPGFHIALNWDPVKDAVKYNIYRRSESTPSYPVNTLNPSPIQVITNCNTIKSLLITSPDSADWKLVAQGLADNNSLFNPCKLNTVTYGTEKYNRLKALARASMPISIAAGWGYKDNTVTSSTVYYYKIVALNASNSIIKTVAQDLRVTAGSFVALPAPTGINLEAGDDAVLITWDSVPGAAGYILERSISSTGSYKRVNGSQYTVQITQHLNGDSLSEPLIGMVDFARYCVLTGKDSTHTVNGFPVSGPINGTSYFYKVTAIDLFKRPGTTSSVAGPVTPVDITPPSVPMDIFATTDDNLGHVAIRWTQVVKNINGHWERPDSTVRYRLYRFTGTDNPNTLPSVYLGEVGTTKGLKSREYSDNDPNLRSQYGNRKWWYRIRSVDHANNISDWSTAASAIVKDITPPGIPRNIISKGYENYIAIKWDPNSEPDIASYVIYRSLCHLGAWVECLPQDTCKQWITYNPSGKPGEGSKKTTTLTHMTDDADRLPCPCSGPFVYLGEVTRPAVESAIKSGDYFFEDHSIPAGSPLCYAYWIKAKDSSDNLSGNFPIPSAAELGEIKCERLHDLTPPEKAIISGLFAEADRIRVEWIGPPTQDTRAYHVYRAEGTNPAIEPPVNQYIWVGGMTVELPPVLPKILTNPYRPPAMTTCDKISIQATPWMSEGYFEDAKINPKITYWYRVVGIDYDGNETPLDSAAAISTFSFSRRMPSPPAMNAPHKETSPCGVTLTWSPAFDASRHKGFIVYKSTSASGQFIPIVVSPVQGNTFTDTDVIAGQKYWYGVAVLLLNGKLSKMCPSQSITP